MRRSTDNGAAEFLLIPRGRRFQSEPPLLRPYFREFAKLSRTTRDARASRAFFLTNTLTCARLFFLNVLFHSRVSFTSPLFYLRYLSPHSFLNATLNDNSHKIKEKKKNVISSVELFFNSFLFFATGNFRNSSSRPIQFSSLLLIFTIF